MNRFGHGSDVMIFQNQAPALPSSADGNINHSSGWIVDANHLVGKHHPKRWIDRAEQAVTKVRFLSRLYGVDIGGSENVNERKALGEQRLFSFSLVACDATRLRPVGSAPLPLKNESAAWGLLLRRTRANSIV